jgi:ABC-type transporter Mla MlaB component
VSSVTDFSETEDTENTALPREKRMLKITRAVLSEREITLQLDGRVTGQWAELLRVSGESVLDEGLTLNVDLKNTSFIDCEGIAVIKNLIQRGARDVNSPLFVAELIRKCKEQQT